MKRTYIPYAIIFFVLSLSYATVPPSHDDDVALYSECTTPDNRTGTCVNIRECKAAVDLLQRGIVSENIIKFLRQSRCDSGHDVAVCCANYTLAGNILFDAKDCIPPVNNRIYGGTTTEIAEFPWAVLLSYKKPFDQYGFHCVGTLISTRYILTAAHCVNKMPPDWIIHSVRLGEYNLETNPDCMETSANETICAPNPVDLEIEQIIVHPKYNSSSRQQYHDIALLRTIQPVHFNAYVRPACLPIDEQWRHNPLTNRTAEISGWGQTPEASYSAVKMKAEVVVWDITACEDKFQALDINIKGTYHVCAGGEFGVDTCRGDSGGALVVTAQANKRGYSFVGGIVSFGIKNCGLEGWPGVYTRVGQYIEWIQQSIEA